MKHEYIISIDIGTSSTKTALINANGEFVYSTAWKNKVYYLKKNMVEQNPDEIYHGLIITIKRLFEETDVKPKNIWALIIDGILHSITPISSDNAMLANSIIWADSRGFNQSELLRKELDNREIRKRTGCSINPLYFPSKILWYKQNAKDLYRKTSKFISIKEYVLFNLTKEYIVDKSTASGTGLFNIAEENWDTSLLHHLGMTKKNLSEIVEPLHSMNLKKIYLPEDLTFLDGIPLIVGASDGPLAHLGSAGLDESKLSLTIGSSAAMRKWLKNPEINPDEESWCYYLAERNWISGGVAHDAGLAIEWLGKKLFGQELNYKEISKEIGSTPIGANGIVFIPFLSGERAPHYKPWARGFIYGLSYNHEKAHIYRAFLEGLGYRLKKIYNMLSRGRERTLVINGGMTGSKPLLQILSDYMGKKFIIPSNREATTVGNLILALMFLGEIGSLKEGNKFNVEKESINPRTDLHREYNKVYEKQERLYKLLYQSNPL